MLTSLDGTRIILAENLIFRSSSTVPSSFGNRPDTRCSVGRGGKKERSCVSIDVTLLVEFLSLLSFLESRISTSRTAITLSLSLSVSHPPLSSISITRGGESTDSVGLGGRRRQFFRVSVRLRKIDAFRGRLTSIITVEPTKWNNTGDLSRQRGGKGELGKFA